MLVRNVLGSLLFAAALTAAAAEFDVGQKDKQFSVSHLKIKAGDTVNFVNNDPFFHNVFSLSDTKTFDLGSYPQGQSRKLTFNNPGVVEVECAIHSQMKLIIEVAE
ncbi:MAG TPA: plastocyanin/azurin family copper-binding protein [Acidiferrobacterales bacterium]|jgi:plastocyanin